MLDNPIYRVVDDRRQIDKTQYDKDISRAIDQLRIRKQRRKKVKINNPKSLLKKLDLQSEGEESEDIVQKKIRMIALDPT